MYEQQEHQAPQLAFDAWIESYRSMCPGYSIDGRQPEDFAGVVRALSIHGLPALEIACNDYRIDRTELDTRREDVDFYGAVIQVGGRSVVALDDETLHLETGDVALIDKSSPVSYIADRAGTHWLCIQIPRPALISHLGFAPKSGSYARSGAAAGRLLRELAASGMVADADTASAANAYLQMTAYDLIGAVAAPQSPAGRRNDKLFERVRAIVQERFADPDFDPGELALQAGISLRYVHKLFTERGLTCRELIYALRLDHAARLLAVRRGQPLSEIAYASGFRDYAHFARRFRARYGQSPGAHLGARGN